MITPIEKKRVEEKKADWNKKNKEMKNLFYMVEDSYPRLSSLSRMFSGKTRMHGLLKKNEGIFSFADSEWDKNGFDFFKQKEIEFNKNYEDFMKIFHRYEKKIPAKK